MISKIRFWFEFHWNANQVNAIWLQMMQQQMAFDRNLYDEREIALNTFENQWMPESDLHFKIDSRFASVACPTSADSDSLTRTVDGNSWLGWCVGAVCGDPQSVIRSKNCLAIRTRRSLWQSYQSQCGTSIKKTGWVGCAEIPRHFAPIRCPNAWVAYVRNMNCNCKWQSSVNPLIHRFCCCWTSFARQRPIQNNMHDSHKVAQAHPNMAMTRTLWDHFWLSWLFSCVRE